MLVVLDDLHNKADLDGLWPTGSAGRVLITTVNPLDFSDDQGALLHPVVVFSHTEALSLLVSRLAADPGKCKGAEELAAELGYEPLAIAQASATIANSALSCRDYQDRWARKRAELAGRIGSHRPPRPSPGCSPPSMPNGCRGAVPGPC